MGLRNSDTGWGWIAVLLHWTTALLVGGMMVLGLIMVDLTTDPMRQFTLYQLHKSIGFVVLALTLIRLLWRAANPTPRAPAGMPGWQHRAAAVSHALLYALLIALPVAGWLTASASPLGLPTLIFGVIPVPHLVGPDEASERLFADVHAALAWALAGVLAVHVAAALKHQWVDRDGVLARMLPGLLRSPVRARR